LLASQLTGGSACGAVPLASGPRQWCQLSSRSGGTSPADAVTVAPNRIRANISGFIMHSLRNQSAATVAGFSEKYIGTAANFRRKHEGLATHSGGSHHVTRYTPEPPNVRPHACRRRTGHGDAPRASREGCRAERPTDARVHR